MEKNIFEGAKFGDKFVNKEGDVMIYHFKGQYHNLISEEGNTFTYKNNGVQYGFKESYKDIVGKYREPFDETKLNKIANEQYPDFVFRDSSVSN